MQTGRITVALAMVVGSLLAGCTSTNTLNDTNWILANLNGQPVASEPLITNTFVKGTISGTDGCNSYSTSYTVKGGKFSINKNIAATRWHARSRSCSRHRVHHGVDPGCCVQYQGPAIDPYGCKRYELVTFTRQSSELGGTSWIVTGYNNGKQAVVSVILIRK